MPKDKLIVNESPNGSIILPDEEASRVAAFCLDRKPVEGVRTPEHLPFYALARFVFKEADFTEGNFPTLAAYAAEHGQIAAVMAISPARDEEGEGMNVEVRFSTEHDETVQGYEEAVEKFGSFIGVLEMVERLKRGGFGDTEGEEWKQG